jgi:hypothetical protein
VTTRYARLTSAAAVALVTPALLGGAASASAAPANDDFRDAVSVHIGSRVNGNVKGATAQRGEPHHARSLARHSVWYRFTAVRKVAVALSTCRSNFDSVVAVYSGRRLGALHAVDFNNDGCGTVGAGSRVSFTARRGRTYRIAVAGFSASGRFTLTVRRLHPPPNDDFVDATRLALGSTVASTLIHATTELYEPRAGDTGSVWFRLTVSARRSVRLDIPNCDDSELPAVSVFTGRRVSGLHYIVDDICDVRFTAKAGVNYRIQVTSEAHLQSAFRIRARAG